MGGGDGAVEVVDGTSAGSSRSAPGMSPVVLLEEPSAAAGTAHQLATGSADWVDPQHEPIMVS